MDCCIKLSNSSSAVRCFNVSFRKPARESFWKGKCINHHRNVPKKKRTVQILQKISNTLESIFSSVSSLGGFLAIILNFTFFFNFFRRLGFCVQKGCRNHFKLMVVDWSRGVKIET